MPLFSVSLNILLLGISYTWNYTIHCLFFFICSELGIGMGNTCKPMAVSFQCMTKYTVFCVSRYVILIKKHKHITQQFFSYRILRCHWWVSTRVSDCSNDKKEILNFYIYLLRTGQYLCESRICPKQELGSLHKNTYYLGTFPLPFIH